MITWVITISIFFSLIKGEYYISHSVVPSYLYRKFENLEEDIFPRDIRIIMSLTRISGTLFYSIDRHKNQLIVNLKDNKETAMFLEFNKQSFDFSISQLCSCEKCLYVVMNLRIQIRDRIYIECNGGRAQIRNFKKTKEMNEDYIIPFTEEEFKVETLNEAHMWIVNNQRYKNVYPNPEQLSGCIFDVMYLNQDIQFTNFSKDIALKCNKTCKKDLCNGGQCIETFVNSICDCTTTFKNGPNCNKTLHPMNITAVTPSLQFNSFKLSWKSLSTQIFILENLNIRLILNRISAELNLEYHEKETKMILKSILSNSYTPNTNYILVAAFSEKYMTIKISNNTSWHYVVITTNKDLRKEKFTSITFRSGNGVIEMVYKGLVKEYIWRSIEIQEYHKIENGELMNLFTTASSVKDSKNIILIVFFIGLLVVILIIVPAGILIVRRRIITDRQIIHDLFQSSVSINIRKNKEIDQLMDALQKEEGDELTLRINPLQGECSENYSGIKTEEEQKSIHELSDLPNRNQENQVESVEDESNESNVLEEEKWSMLDDDDKHFVTKERIDSNMGESSAGDILELIVKTWDGKTINIQIHKEDRCINIKNKINEKIGIPTEDQNLIYESLTLEDDKTVTECMIVDKSVINVYAIPPSGRL